MIADPAAAVLVERSATGRAWRLKPANDAAGLSLAQRLGLPEVVGRLLAMRGVAEDQALAFLAPKLKDWLPDPSHLLDLDRAVARLADAIKDGETVGVIGDYDVDGATSTALARRYLAALGISTVCHIPDRLSEGYGPSPFALDRLAEAGCRLVLTLDSGTTAHEALAHARAQGQEVIVVDHHSAEDRLPPSLALINPNRADQESPLGHLAAVGVTFVTLVGLNRELRRRGFFASRAEPDLMGWLDLVALGTVCDVVPLLGLNRAFVVQGLKVAQRKLSPGLAALLQAVNLERLDDARKLGFVVGPRVNAGGRMGESALAAELLATDDPERAAMLANRLHELNGLRQEVEKVCVEAASAEARAQAQAGAKVLVVAGDGWHPGVIGIVASRLVERFHRPVMVVGLQDGVGKGSGRSVPGFDLGRAVIEARQAGVLSAGGGHPMAAGLTVAASRLDELRRRLNEAADLADTAGGAVAGAKPLELDGELPASAATSALCDKLNRLTPYGPGNDEPLFAVGDATVARAAVVGNGHVSLTLRASDGRSLKAIAFRAKEGPLGQALLTATGPVRLAGHLRVDEWQGRRSASLHVRDAAV